MGNLIVSVVQRLFIGFLRFCLKGCVGFVVFRVRNVSKLYRGLVFDGCVLGWFFGFGFVLGLGVGGKRSKKAKKG